MKTMRDFLSGYNKRDVGPFLEAIAKQFDFYKQRHIDMFKDGISVPGLTLLYLFNDLPPKTYLHFSMRNTKGYINSLNTTLWVAQALFSIESMKRTLLNYDITSTVKGVIHVRR